MPTRPPKRRQCGTPTAHERLLEMHPSFRVRQAAIERQTDRWIALAGRRARSGTLTIPVVVHVVWRTAAENISVAQIRSQIAALNRDFGLTNLDRSSVPTPWTSLVGKARVKFALAKKDPKGKSTSGITRTKTKKASFGTGDSIKRVSAGGAAAWPRSKYLNLWVGTLQNGLLGYAQFPGGPAATDGVVILNTAFGTAGTAAAPFNLGRTATHEIGHWLNLHHIWGDRSDCGGTDYVIDTPKAQLPNYGKPTFPHISCTNGPNGDMFCNYMDYVDDAAMVMFTLGQVARMEATLNGPRSSLGS
jgi:hypothetical protein